MINKQVMKAWEQQNKLTPQRRYQIINNKRAISNKMLSREEAAYICAAESGVDLHKYLPKELVDKIGSLSQQYKNVKSSDRVVVDNKLKTINILKERIFNFDKECLGIKDSILPGKIINESKIMMVLYAKTYLFENSVRNVIRIVLKNKHKEKNWWSNINKNLQVKIENRKKQERNFPWMGKRGEDELCYSDIGDLKKIIEDNWQDFSWVGDKGKLFNFFDIIEKIRNIIAHHNLVEEDDRDLLNVSLKSWTKTVESNKASLQLMEQS